MGNTENYISLTSFITEIPLNVMYCSFEPRKCSVSRLLVCVYVSTYVPRNPHHCYHQSDKTAQR